MVSRRAFLNQVSAASGGFALSVLSQGQTFEGSRAGDIRQIEGIDLCWCPPGSFMMGSPPEETGHRADEVQVRVTLTRGFWTAKYEATQGQWRRIVGAFPNEAPSATFGSADTR